MLKNSRRSNKKKRITKLGELPFEEMEFDTSGLGPRQIGGNSNYKPRMSKLTPLTSSQDKKVTTPFKCTRKHVDPSDDEGIEEGEEKDENTNEDIKSEIDSEGKKTTKKSSKAPTEKVVSKPTTAPNPVIPVILEKDFSTRQEFL